MLLFTFVSLSTGAAETPKPKSTAELIAVSKPTDWRTPAQENLLYMNIPAGQVVIELSPEFAPKHVERIRALAKEKYWDGLAIVRVQDNYVVQWADPNAENPALKKKAKAVKEVLPSELDVETDKQIFFNPLPDKDTYTEVTGFFNGMAAGRNADGKRTWLLHCYGSVGVGRDVKPESGDGTELYTVIGHSPRHLDRNVAIVGKILRGVEFLASLPRGHGEMGFFAKDKGEKPLQIASIQLGSEVAKKDRVNLEVLRTDTVLFQELLQMRRTMPNEWFLFRSGHVDACNFNIPVRDKK